jgi:uncharacterized damage-inducible protein DinB
VILSDPVCAIRDERGVQVSGDSVTRHVEWRDDMSTSPKAGRPRQYDLEPAAGFADPTVAWIVTALDELGERLFDLIQDLAQESMDFVPEGGGNSIAMLVVHMASVEAAWVSRITQVAIPPGLESTWKAGKQDASGDLPRSSMSAPQLVALCRRVRQEFTRPALAALTKIDVEGPGGQGSMTVRGTLMHLIWHWTYHSGQVGLLRRLCGPRYQWTFDQHASSHVS